MKHSGLKTMNDTLTSDPAGAFRKFEHAMKKLVAPIKSSVEHKPKRRSAKKK